MVKKDKESANAGKVKEYATIKKLSFVHSTRCTFLKNIFNTYTDAATT